MSSKPPGTAQSDEANVYCPTRVGPRYGMIEPPQMPHDHRSTTMSGISRPHLPPPTHLEPSFAPQSPQVRPPYSDLPTRAPYPPYYRQQQYEHGSNQSYRAVAHATSNPEQPPYNHGYPHPPLYPQKVSYQSTNPGTLYEALSPVDYANHGPPPEPPLFSQGGYTASSPYHGAGLPHHQSPTNSYNSSATSSSGRATGPMQFARPATSPETSLHIPSM